MSASEIRKSTGGTCEGLPRKCVPVILLAARHWPGAGPTASNTLHGSARAPTWADSPVAVMDHQTGLPKFESADSAIHNSQILSATAF